MGCGSCRKSLSEFKKSIKAKGANDLTPRQARIEARKARVAERNARILRRRARMARRNEK